MEQSAYRVDVGDAVADRDCVLAMWQLCGFGGGPAENATRYDWFYLRNPQGRGRLYLLRASGSDEVLGSVGVGARDFFRSGMAGCSGGTLVDFVVHPGHRSLFPALLLQRTVCEHEFQRCAFVYGLPLAKAVPVVARLPGAMRFASGTYVRVVRSATYIRRKAAWLPVRMADFFGSSIDLLRLIHIRLVLLFSGVRSHLLDDEYPQLDNCLRKIVEKEGVTIGDRSREVLAWRARSPGQVLAIAFQDKRSGETIGYAMGGLESGSLSILDFVVPLDSRQTRSIWLELSRRAAMLGATVVRVEFGGCERVILQLRSAGYIHRGSRPGFVILRDPVDAAAASWWFTRFDEDV